jgi:cytochrome c oxidase subunit 3
MPPTLPGSKSDLGGRPPIQDDFPGGGGGGNPEDRGGARRASLTGIVIVMAASLMTFSAFISALIVRRGLSNDWSSIPLPPILWANTAVLVASSIVLDSARRALNHGKRQAFNWIWGAGTLLGATFLAGQVVAWRQLVAQGIYLATNPSSAFFYVLTWAHAVHAIGGLAALLYVMWKAARYQLGPVKRTAVTVSTLFWHFLDVLWLLLMTLFLFW